ncbi:DUF397 domain-containing protein [Streptomyces afghaniensis]|uniref:DUF397 domain-containing protein n=1 Tax=Streptomyces afghaniensis TaxID=66865 RepID=UPI0027824A5D|nr:DUF397 domain-containing protein [Streptomyces afghaniensis]MDQ1016881.1 hypothetical protein [Streptomyces afghaniensis]
MKPNSNIDLSSVQWRKSCYSNGTGGDCVEVAEVSPLQWRKSSYSNGTGGECIEVADNFPGTVPVRDSKNPEGPALMFPTRAWALFIKSL